MNALHRILFGLAVMVATARAESLTGQWSPVPGRDVFILRQSGDSLTGVIRSAGGKTYKIVDGNVKGNEVVFFVLHEAADDPEVIANGGNPFHNFARGTVNGNELTIAGSRESTSIHPYQLVLKRLTKK